MELSVEMPLDGDGYLDRECPSCGGSFRWHHGPIGEVPAGAPEVDGYYCLYCGQPAPTDEWLTREQVEVVQRTVAAAAVRIVQDGLDGSLDKLNRTGLVRAELHADPVPPAPPLVVDEVPTLTVASPCHPYEPVKLIGIWSEPLHCLVCGAAYVVF